VLIAGLFNARRIGSMSRDSLEQVAAADNSQSLAKAINFVVALKAFWQSGGKFQCATESLTPQ
jgi:hypothetical protein